MAAEPATSSEPSVRGPPRSNTPDTDCHCSHAGPAAAPEMGSIATSARSRIVHRRIASSVLGVRTIFQRPCCKTLRLGLVDSRREAILALLQTHGPATPAEGA